MKSRHFWIFCLLLAAGYVAHGQSYVISYGSAPVLCRPSTAPTQVPTCFSVLSYSWGVTQIAAGSGSGGSGAGKPVVENVEITKLLDGASTALFLDMLTGKHIPQVLIAYYDNPTDAAALKPTYTVLLSNAFVVSEQAADSSGGSPMESIGLTYETIEISYYQKNAEGIFAAPVQVTYNVATNRVS
jgi:type VI secretion system secreted protein Hcp